MSRSLVILGAALLLFPASSGLASSAPNGSTASPFVLAASELSPRASVVAQRRIAPKSADGQVTAYERTFARAKLGSSNTGRSRTVDSAATAVVAR